MSKIRLHGSSSGYVEIAPPAAGSSETITLPNSAGEVLLSDGSAASLTQIPAASIVGICTSGLTKTGGFGKILQYKIVNKTDTGSSTSTSAVEISSDFRITLTPTASDSIIVVTCDLNLSHIGGYTQCIRIVKNTASDFSGTQSDFMTPDVYNNDTDGHAPHYGGGDNTMMPVHFRVFETSGNTTARTYGMTWATSGGTNYVNGWNTSSYNGVSTFSVMEIAA